MIGESKEGHDSVRIGIMRVEEIKMDSGGYPVIEKGIHIHFDRIPTGEELLETESHEAKNLWNEDLRDVALSDSIFALRVGRSFPVNHGYIDDWSICLFTNKRRLRLVENLEEKRVNQLASCVQSFHEIDFLVNSIRDDRVKKLILCHFA